MWCVPILSEIDSRCPYVQNSQTYKKMFGFLFQKNDYWFKNIFLNTFRSYCNSVCIFFFLKRRSSRSLKISFSTLFKFPADPYIVYIQNCSFFTMTIGQNRRKDIEITENFKLPDVFCEHSGEAKEAFRENICKTILLIINRGSKYRIFKSVDVFRST